jgi:hypothetical protein
MAAMMPGISSLVTKLDQAANATLIKAEAMTSLNRLMGLHPWQLSYLMAAC